MPYADDFDVTEPVGSTTPANQIDDVIREFKRALQQRLDDITGADWQLDDPIDLTKYGISVRLRSKQVGQAAEFDNGNSGTARTINWDEGNFQRLTLNGNCTLTLTNPQIGTYVLRVINSGSFTLVWPSGSIGPGGTIPSPTANRNTIYTIYYSGTHYFVGVFGANFNPA